MRTTVQLNQPLCGVIKDDSNFQNIEIALLELHTFYNETKK